MHTLMDLFSDTSASATYVYCVVKSALRDRRTGGVGVRAPKLGRVPKGLWGTGKPRVLDAGDGYHLLVASAPLGLYAAAAIEAKLDDLDWVAERATEHEAVVEHATNLGTVVPMKLLTLFTNDERAVSHVRKMKNSLDRVVDRIAGCEEWGLRILFDPTRAARAAADEAKYAAGSGRGELEARSRSNETVSGTSFLRRKKALDDERLRAGARGAAAVDELYERLTKNVRSAHRRAAPTDDLAERVVLDAVFLVPRGSVKKLKSIVAASAKSLVDDGFDVTLGGPWPAYSFIGGR
jgi:hypothetical protein